MLRVPANLPHLRGQAGAIGGKAIETTAPDSTTTSEDPRRPEPVDEEVR